VDSLILRNHDMRELHLFAGAGGGILGGMLLGHITVAAVEIEPYCQEVLRARQRDGILPEFPIYGDIRKFDGRPWRGAVDIVAGGFPCQDISTAGKGEGINGEKSGLWREMHRVASEIRPEFVFVENSPELVRRGLARIISDFARIGYGLRWVCLRCSPFGFNQERRRFYGLAHPLPRNEKLGWNIPRSWWLAKQATQHLVRSPKSEPSMVGVVNGVAHRMDRLRAIGNGQVPEVAATAFRILSEGLI